MPGSVTSTGFTARKHPREIRLVAFDLLAIDGDDIRSQPLHARKDRLARCWRAHTLVAFKAARDIRIRSALQLSLLCLASRLMRRLARASNRRTAQPFCHMAERCLRADIVNGAVLQRP